jgi:hypothetical protein
MYTAKPVANAMPAVVTASPGDRDTERPAAGDWPVRRPLNYWQQRPSHLQADFEGWGHRNGGMQRTRSSRTLAGALLLAVCGPIAVTAITIAPNVPAPQAKVIDAVHQKFGKHHGRYSGPRGFLRSHTGTTTNT